MYSSLEIEWVKAAQKMCGLSEPKGMATWNGMRWNMVLMWRGFQLWWSGEEVCRRIGRRTENTVTDISGGTSSRIERE
jgi:hypothetical protein